VIASEGSDERLRNWAQGLAQALPNASSLLLPGRWHGVATEHLVPALAQFFTGESEAWE
jgi:hypothetical protein